MHGFKHQKRAKQPPPAASGTEFEKELPRYSFDRRHRTADMPARRSQYCITSPPDFIMPYGVSGYYEFFSGSKYDKATDAEEKVPESPETTEKAGSTDTTQVPTEDIQIVGARADAEEKQSVREASADYSEELLSDEEFFHVSKNKKMDEKNAYEFVKAKQTFGTLAAEDVKQVAALLRKKIDAMDTEKAKLKSDILTLEQREFQLRRKVIRLENMAGQFERQEAEIQQENAVYAMAKSSAEANFKEEMRALDSPHRKSRAAHKAKLDEMGVLLKQALDCGSDQIEIEGG